MMSEKNIITVHKVFFAWNEDKEASWLQLMALRGWYLEEVSFFTYRFVRRKPGDVVYRFDFRPMKNRKELEEYTGLFEDAGWQYVASLSSWHYFRREKTGAGCDEIFSDNRSKLEKYRRLQLTMLVTSNAALISPIYLLRVVNHQPIIWVLLGILILIDVLLLYEILRITKLIHSLKKNLKE